MNLNSVANNFFNQLLYCIEDNNRSKGFESIIGVFIWLENNTLVVLDYYLQEI